MKDKNIEDIIRINLVTKNKTKPISLFSGKNIVIIIKHEDEDEDLTNNIFNISYEDCLLQNKSFIQLKDFIKENGGFILPYIEKKGLKHMIKEMKEPKRKPRGHYTLEELLKGFEDPEVLKNWEEYKQSDEFKEWENMKPVGNEFW